jgi:DNA repair exonuclease SbcCD ATPase subunit
VWCSAAGFKIRKNNMSCSKKVNFSRKRSVGDDFQEENIDCEELETTVRGHTKELETEGKDPEEIKELKKKLQEITLQNQELKNKDREKDIYRATVEVGLRRKISELEENIQETDRLKKEAESAVHAQREYYKKKQQERDVINEQLQDRIYGFINTAQKQVDGTNHLCGEIRHAIDLQRRLIDAFLRVIDLREEYLRTSFPICRSTIRKEDRYRKSRIRVELVLGVLLTLMVVACLIFLL